jgi:hypothetical protein
MKAHLHLLPLVCLVCLTVCAVAQSTTDYDALVQQGKTQLQAGNNDAAGASAAAALKLNPDRWEGYALVGGVMINPHNCEAANHFLAAALRNAPAEKQTGIQNLMDQCQNPVQAASANTSSSSSPTLQETSDWLAKTLKEYSGRTRQNDDGPEILRTLDAGIKDSCMFYQIQQSSFVTNGKRKTETWKTEIPLGAVTAVYDGLEIHDGNHPRIETFPISAIQFTRPELGTSAEDAIEIVIEQTPSAQLGPEAPQPPAMIIPRIENAFKHAVELCHGTYSHSQPKEPF